MSRCSQTWCSTKHTVDNLNFAAPKIGQNSNPNWIVGTNIEILIGKISAWKMRLFEWCIQTLWNEMSSFMLHFQAYTTTPQKILSFLWFSRIRAPYSLCKRILPPPWVALVFLFTSCQKLPLIKFESLCMMQSLSRFERGTSFQRNAKSWCHLKLASLNFE